MMALKMMAMAMVVSMMMGALYVAYFEPKHAPHLFVTIRAVWSLICCICLSLLKTIVASLFDLRFLGEIPQVGKFWSALLFSAFSRFCDIFSKISFIKEKNLLHCMACFLVVAKFAADLTTLRLIEGLDTFSLKFSLPNFTSSFHPTPTSPYLTSTHIYPSIVSLGNTVNLSFQITSSIGIASIALHWKAPNGGASYQQVCQPLLLASFSTPYYCIYSTSCLMQSSWQTPGNYTVSAVVQDYSCHSFEAALGVVTLKLPPVDPQPDATLHVSVAHTSNRATTASNASFSIGSRCLQNARANSSDPMVSVLLSCGLPSFPVATKAVLPGCASSPSSVSSTLGNGALKNYNWNINWTCSAPRRLAHLIDVMCNAGAGCHSGGDALAQCRWREAIAAHLGASVKLNRSHHHHSSYQCQCSASFSGPYCQPTVYQQLHSLIRNASFHKQVSDQFSFQDPGRHPLYIYQDPRDPATSFQPRCPYGLKLVPSQRCIDVSFYDAGQREILGVTEQLRILVQPLKDAFNASDASIISESCERCGGFTAACPVACNPLTPDLCATDCPLALCYRCDAFRFILMKMSVYPGLIPLLDHAFQSEPLPFYTSGTANNSFSPFEAALNISNSATFAPFGTSDPKCWTIWYTGTYYLHCALHAVLYYVIWPGILSFKVFTCYQDCRSALTPMIKIRKNLRQCSYCLSGNLSPHDPCLVRCRKNHSIHRSCLHNLNCSQVNVRCPACCLEPPPAIEWLFPTRHLPDFAPENLRPDARGAGGALRDSQPVSLLSIDMVAAKMRSPKIVLRSTACGQNRPRLNLWSRKSGLCFFRTGCKIPRVPGIPVSQAFSNACSRKRVISSMHLTVLVIQKLSNSAAHDMCNMMLARVNAVLAARSPEGLCKQGLTLLSGNHFSRAAKAFAAGSVSGNTRCMAELSWMLCNGRLGVKQDEARAFKLATLGVQRNCHHCMAALSKCLADGCGCEQDFKCSLRLAHQSAEAGSRLGQYMLGQLNYDSNAHISAKYNRSQNPGMSIRVAIRNFSLAAAQGLPSASCMLGFLKEYGCTEIPADHSEAIRLYSTAAAHGDGRALYRLALCHERGRGVPQNVALAKDFYIRAREAGFHADTIRSNLARLGPAPPPPKPSRLKAVLSVLSSCFPTSIFKWLRATCPVAGPTFLLLACIVASCAAGSILHDYRTENVLFFSMVTLGLSFAFEELWRS